MTNLRFTLCAALMLSASLCAAALAQQSPPGSHHRAITVKRLTGATLMEVGRESSLVWHFGVDRFRLEIRGPRRDALVQRLLGRAADVNQIEGRWRLDEKKNRLILDDLHAGNIKNAQRVELEIWPAGMLRADLGDHQYNIDELDICGRWESVGKGPKVSWTFRFEPLVTVGNSVVVQAQEARLPANLVTQLFGQRVDASEIKGQWEFKWSTGRLVLTKLAAGNQRRTQPVETTVKPVGIKTIELFGRQYRRTKWLRRSAFNPDTRFGKTAPDRKVSDR